MKIEIASPPELTDEQASKTDLHSFQNVLTVVCGELQFLERMSGDACDFSECIGACRGLTEAFTDRRKAVALLRDAGALVADIRGRVDAAVERMPEETREGRFARESRRNMLDVLEIVEVRVAEMLDRADAGDVWTDVAADDVAENLRRVFEVIAGNAKGRYGIVFSEADRTEGDYVVDIRIEGRPDGTVRMPAVVNDVLRDLAANARKYTDPGGTVVARLADLGDELLLEVRDTGRGIPADELEKVVDFGYRGSNVGPDETKGGGFGLTKAWHVCHRLGGRMWIESEPGEGTTVTLRIPKPSDDAS